MKHIKEWNTCDRCGLEIKNTLIRKGKAKIKLEIQKKLTILIVCLTILELFCTQKKKKLTYALSAGKNLKGG